jgi:hypothetical protein
MTDLADKHDPVGAKIRAIKELRAACDIGLRDAKDGIEQYVAVHPGATWHDAAVDLASVYPKRKPTIADELVDLRAENTALRKWLRDLIAVDDEDINAVVARMRAPDIEPIP